MSWITSAASLAWTLIRFWLAIVVSWALHPRVWWISMTPFRVLHYLTARVAQESTYNPDAYNADDNGASSAGLLQFWAPTWSALAGLPLDDRFSPWLSGYYGVVMLDDALGRSWKWWIVLRLPVTGYVSMCYLWTHGTAADNAWSSITGGLAQLRDESRAVWGYLLWSLVWGLMGILAVLAVLRAWARRPGAPKADRKGWVFRTFGRKELGS